MLVFEGTADGFTFHGTDTVQGSILFVRALLSTHDELLASPPDCAGSFTCSARYANVDPISGLQQFTVHQTITCVYGSPVPYVIVKACPVTAR